MKIPRKKYGAEVPSMAMGDIAFLLLIFFVILAKAHDDSHIKWDPAKLPKLIQADAAQVSVAIDEDNKVYLNGVEIGIDALADRIKADLGDAEPGRRIVHLKVHNEATALHFEPVIEAVGEAGGDLFHMVDLKRKQE